jgi:HK97 gp10 family phage protein
MEIEASFDGVEEALKRLKTLSEDAQYRGARAAMQKGAELVRAKAVMNAKVINNPDTDTEIWKNITVRFASRRFKRTGDVMFRVGVMGGAVDYSKKKGPDGKSVTLATYSGSPGGDTWYWRLVEFGTSKAAARPFMRPALFDQPDITMSVISKSMNIFIDNAIKRAKR